MEVAVSIPGINFERVLGNKTFLYSDITESQFKIFRKNKDLLSGKELQVLQEIEQIKKQTKNKEAFRYQNDTPDPSVDRHDSSGRA